MKNHRRLANIKALVNKYNLDTSPPPADSLFWRMWNAGGLAIAQKTLETDFLQGIKNGILDPTHYGAFNVSDIYYCYNGADDYGLAAGRTRDNILKEYLLEKKASYNRYNRTSCTTWNLSGPASVVPTATVLAYSNFERSVANGTASQGDVSDPIFALIMMIPCEYLWAWLASELAQPAKGNIYASWITDNDSTDGAYAIGNYLEGYISQNPIDERTATAIYLTAMNYEYDNFFTATSQSS